MFLTNKSIPLPSTVLAHQHEDAIIRLIWNDILAPIADDLTSFDAQLASFLPLATNSATDVSKHIFAAGGKRLRPALFFFVARLVEYRGEHLQSMAAVCEFVHTASLLHDDVVDSSTLRRNKPTANSIWGDQTSVLVGDLIYARASELMAETGYLDIVSTFARAIRLMSEGELLQLEEIFHFNIGRDRYFDILKNKTATLIAATCKAPAILADRAGVEVGALSQFGEALGTAFQLVDDALDYGDSAAQLGKPAMHDLEEGKVTMPLILLRERLTASQWQGLEAEFLESRGKYQVFAKKIHDLVWREGTVEETLSIADGWTHRALRALEIFPPSKARSDLQGLAERLVRRDR